MASIQLFLTWHASLIEEYCYFGPSSDAVGLRASRHKIPSSLQAVLRDFLMTAGRTPTWPSQPAEQTPLTIWGESLLQSFPWASRVCSGKKRFKSCDCAWLEESWGKTFNVNGKWNANFDSGWLFHACVGKTQSATRVRARCERLRRSLNRENKSVKWTSCI
jgi:hypothetical protein